MWTENLRVECSSGNLAMPPQIDHVTEGHRLAHLPIHTLYGVKAAPQDHFHMLGPPPHKAHQDLLLLADL